MSDFDRSEGLGQTDLPICAVYVHDVEVGRFLFLRQGEAFPVWLGKRDWRLLMTGVEAPPGITGWIRQNGYHQVRGAWY